MRKLTSLDVVDGGLEGAGKVADDRHLGLDTATPPVISFST